MKDRKVFLYLWKFSVLGALCAFILLVARKADKGTMINKMRNWTAAASLFLFLLPLASAQLTPNIWKKFIGEPVPVGTPDLIDYSYAGYKNGEEAIPDDFTLPVFDVTDYGAVPDDGKSDTEGIKAAISDVSSGGGIVFFPPGQFDVLTAGETLESIYVYGDNVVLRGSGAEGAEYGGTTIKQQNSPNVYGQMYRLFRTGWRVHKPGRVTTVSGSFPKGTKHFDVVDSSSLLSRNFVKITATVKGTSGDTDSWEDWNQYSSRSMDEMPNSYARIRDGIGVYELHEIDRIEGNRVCIKTPTITHLNSNFTVNFIDLAVGIGFEDLHIDGNLQETYVHHEYYGYGGVMLQFTAHSWIRRCRFSNTVNAFGLHNSYGTSAIAIIVDGKFGHQPGGVHASTYCFIGLLEDHTDKGVFHGSVVANRSAGTVFWRVGGPKLRGPDAHGDFPRHTLFDNYYCRSHENSGGGAGIRPNHLNGYTRWNNTVADSSTFNPWAPGGGFTATQTNLIGYKTLGGTIPGDAYVEGFGTHVSPNSLYEAQLERRLGALPAWVNASKDMYREFVERIVSDSTQPETTATPSVDPDSGGPKIEGPWLWVLVPDEHLDKSTDLLAKASGGNVTEQQIATTGASPGSRVGDYVWTPLKISTSDNNNITNMTRPLGWNGNNRVIYGFITLNSPQEQNTRMFVGSDDAVKVWLNGKLVREEITRRSASDYRGSFPVTLKQGRNTLLVAVDNATGGWSGFFGFRADAEYTVLSYTGIGYVLPNVVINTGDTFTLDIYAEDATDLVEWQFDIAFDPLLLEAIEVSKGYFLESEDRVTFSQKGTIDNKSGIITGLSEAILNGNSVSGTGMLLSVTFAVKAGGKTQLTLSNFRFGDSTGRAIPAGPHEVALVVKDRLIWDVNGDERVNILDLVLVAQDLGKPASVDSRTDVNSDGVVNILDLVLVAQHLGESTAAAALSTVAIENVKELDPATVRAWIAQAHVENDGSLAFQQGIANLERLLTSLIPEETALLPNYPNPFNPETWIPYQLSDPAEVTLRIYAVNGTQVRTLAVGLMPAGIYQNRSRAAYWNGRNNVGEPIASGIYFYTLTAGEFTSTRKMLIRK